MDYFNTNFEQVWYPSHGCLVIVDRRGWKPITEMVKTINLILNKTCDGWKIMSWQYQSIRPPLWSTSPVKSQDLIQAWLLDCLFCALCNNLYHNKKLSVSVWQSFSQCNPNFQGIYHQNQFITDKRVLRLPWTAVKGNGASGVAWKVKHLKKSKFLGGHVKRIIKKIRGWMEKMSNLKFKQLHLEKNHKQ